MEPTPTIRSGEILLEEAASSSPAAARSASSEALPAAILAGIEVEASSSAGASAGSEEVSSSMSVTEREGVGERAGADGEAEDRADTAVDSAAFAEISDLQEEIQDLAQVENEAAAEQAAFAVDPAQATAGERWIDVNLTTQTLIAYEGDTPVLFSAISSGMWQFPTVTGQYQTWMKHEAQNMSGYHLGYNYCLDNVPHVMYFFEDYAIHGAYWHNNFWHAHESRVRQYEPIDAEWLFNWAPLGTVVNVHHVTLSNSKGIGSRVGGKRHAT